MSSSLVERAKEFATKAHEGQVRDYDKGPFIVHPLRVAERTTRYIGGEIATAAALLHDVVEDTEATLEEIRVLFGDAVAKLVAWLTKPPRRQDELRWKYRKRWLAKLDAAPREARIIKLIDRIDNLRDMPQDSPRTKKYAKKSFRLLRALKGTHSGLELELGNLLHALRFPIFPPPSPAKELPRFLPPFSKEPQLLSSFATLPDGGKLELLGTSSPGDPFPWTLQVQTKELPGFAAVKLDKAHIAVIAEMFSDVMKELGNAEAERR